MKLRRERPTKSIGNVNGNWLRKSGADTALVFIHGVLSSNETAWKHPNGTFWPTLLSEESKFSDISVYLLDYPAGLFAGTYSPADAVDLITARFRIDKLFSFPNIIFVCHSMGGILARRFIVKEQSALRGSGRQIGLFLVASPSLGSRYASVIHLITRFPNLYLQSLRSGQSNMWLIELDKDFIKLKESKDINDVKILGKEIIEDNSPFLRRLFRRGQIVHPQSGAKYFSDSIKIPGSNHSTISKPESKSALQHDLLCEFIKDFLQTETFNHHPKTRSSNLLSAFARANESLPTAPPVCFGRDDLIARFVKLFLSESTGPTALVLGGPGIGKTTFTRKVATHHDIAKKFGNRRWFVSLKEAINAESFIYALVRALGFDGANANFESVLGELEKEPGLLVLDNLETPLEAKGSTDPEAEHQQIIIRLSRLAAISGLAILASVRGNVRSREMQWHERLALLPLDLTDSDRLFRYHAPKVSSNDPFLPEFLRALGGVASMIELVASRAAFVDTLDDLWSEWLRLGTRLAVAHRGARHPHNSFNASVELSLQSPRLSEAGRRLFRLLGQSHGGVAREDCRALLTNDTIDAVQELSELTLVHESNGRLDMLPPIRLYAHDEYPPKNADKTKWVFHYLQLCQLGTKITGENGRDVKDRLLPEIYNLESVLLYSAGVDELRKGALTAAPGYGEFARTSGVGSSVPLAKLAGACRAINDPIGEAICLFWYGKIARERSDYRSAHTALISALAIYRQQNDPRGQADCIWSIGEISRECGDHREAEEADHMALPLYEEVGDELGQAHCFASLADIAREKEDFKTAGRRYEKARVLYHRSGNTRGEGNCIKGLGDVAHAQAKFSIAEEEYTRALVIYEKVWSLWGTANCLKGLGDVALARLDFLAAGVEYEKALPLYEQLGDIWGQATCITALGDLRKAEEAVADAAKQYQKSLRLFERITQGYDTGRVYHRLAEISIGSDRNRYIEAARKAWKPLGRPELIARIEKLAG